MCSAFIPPDSVRVHVDTDMNSTDVSQTAVRTPDGRTVLVLFNKYVVAECAACVYNLCVAEVTRMKLCT